MAKRILRRIGIGVAALFLVVTAASLVYNAVTSGGVPAPTLYRGPYVRVDGTTLAYRCWGTRGSSVLLLGGFVEPTWVWHRVGPLLGEKHRVCAVDLPPFGYSQRRGPYTLARWTTLAEGFAGAVHLGAPVVVGHSLGAAVAVSYAVDEPSRLAGIVLLDGDALPIRGGARVLAHLLVPPWFTTVYRIATTSDWIARRVISNAWGTGKPPSSHAFLEEWLRPFRVAGTADAFSELASHGIPGVSTDVLKRVRVPRIVVWGAGDHVDEVSAGRSTAALLRTRFVEIPGAGHLSMLQTPAAVAAAIERVAR